MALRSVSRALQNGEFSSASSASNLRRNTVLANESRSISGTSYTSRRSKNEREYSRKVTPGNRRPQRPERCCADACDTHTVSSVVAPARGSCFSCRIMPKSMT